jgi:hypothetical protein
MPLDASAIGTVEAIFAIIISLHSGPNYLIFFYIAESPNINDCVMLRWECKSKYIEKGMQLSAPGLSLEMLKRKRGVG